MFLFQQTKRDSLFYLFIGTCGLITLSIVFLIFSFLFAESSPSISTIGFGFLTNPSWYPTENTFGIVPIVAGTLAVSLGSLLIAIPLGLLAALFCQFYAPRQIQWTFHRIIELFSGIPSVIFGFWGLTVLVPRINQLHPPGQSLLAAIIVLSLMIFPILALNIISAIEIFCGKNQRTSDSLGISKASFIIKILWPNLKGQFLAGSILSLGRAIGETMAVLMVCGNIPQIPSSIFNPVRTLTSNIALEMSYAMDIHRSALFFSGLLLFLIVVVLTFASQKLNGRFK